MRVQAGRYLRTPKGLLTLVLVILAVVAGRIEGPAIVLPGLVGAVGTAVVVDALFLRWKRRRWMVSDGAVLTGLFVALVLSPFVPWHVFAFASLVSLCSKHLVRTRSANVFNPAAVGLVVVYYLFAAGHSWWGSMPAVTMPVAIAVLLAAGAVVSARVGKALLLLSFLACHFTLFALASVAGDPSNVADVFVPPDLNAALFFAGFMLTDPPTSPTRPADQFTCGVVTATTSFLVFMLSGAAHYLLSGALAGNVLEASLRVRRARRARARGTAHA